MAKRIDPQSAFEAFCNARAAAHLAAADAERARAALLVAEDAAAKAREKLALAAELLRRAHEDGDFFAWGGAL